MISSQAQLPLRSPLAPLPAASRPPAATPKRFNAGHSHWRQGLQLMSQRDWTGAAKAFTRATHLAPK
ncbi:MAG: hypothetical protein Q8M96_11565, partial [Rubrivivax sp.]|nr:hypothetical protein [Rubrivivax sp.]